MQLFKNKIHTHTHARIGKRVGIDGVLQSAQNPSNVTQSLSLSLSLPPSLSLSLSLSRCLCLSVSVFPTWVNIARITSKTFRHHQDDPAVGHPKLLHCFIHGKRVGFVPGNRATSHHHRHVCEYD